MQRVENKQENQGPVGVEKFTPAQVSSLGLTGAGCVTDRAVTNAVLPAQCMCTGGKTWKNSSTNSTKPEYSCQ